MVADVEDNCSEHEEKLIDLCDDLHGDEEASREKRQEPERRPEDR